MKKCLALLLVLALFVALVPQLTVPAAAAEEDIVEYRTDGGTIKFDKSTGTVLGGDQRLQGSVVIPAEIEGVTVRAIGSGAFAHNHLFIDVKLPDTLEFIGMNAFSQSYIENITVPASVTKIENFAFGCRSLEGIWVAEGNTAYSSDDSGVLYDFHKTVVIQAPGALTGSYTIPGSVTEIAESAFSECHKLTGVTIPDSVQIMNREAFSRCEGLTSVSIPGSVVSIGVGAFSSCVNLESLTIQEGVTAIGFRAFGDCVKLQKVVIPASVTVIERSAFTSCDGLQAVEFMDGLAFIGESAFANCAGLTELVIPGTVEKIDQSAFSNCTGLTNVTISKGVREIGLGAFIGCTGLTQLTIPEGVTTIGAVAFSRCSNLVGIAIPASLTKIDAMAFAECGSLKNVYYGGTEEMWNAIAIERENECLTGATIYFNCGENSFKDIYPADYYYIPVLWASENGITSGKPGGIFAPLESCTRCQAVTFLWRAAGCPEPQSMAQRFPDVPNTKENEFFYKAVAWAVEQGITNGRPNGNFSPHDTVNRSEFVTFLWRAEGKPQATTTVSFGDVSRNEFYYDSVRWAVEQGITNGKPGNRFDPLGKCIRGEVVTFLYRYFA